MNLSYSDLWGLLTHPQFSPKLIKELEEIKQNSYSEESYKKLRDAHIKKINEDLTDEWNSCINSAIKDCKKSVSHKQIVFAPIEEEFIRIQGDIKIIKNRSCRNRFIGIIDLLLSEPKDDFIINTQLMKPAYSHSYNGAYIANNGNIYPVSGEYIDNIYLIYRLSDDCVKNWRMN